MDPPAVPRFRWSGEISRRTAPGLFVWSHGSHKGGGETEKKKGPRIQKASLFLQERRTNLRKGEWKEKKPKKTLIIN